MARNLSIERFTDRSRQIAWQECQHKRYWAYEHDEGLEPIRPNIDIQIGQAVHTGTALLLNGQSLIKAVSRAQQDLTGLPFLQLQKDLVHGLLAVIKHAWLPKLISQYEILSTEHEEQRELEPGLVMMARSDWIGKARQTGRITLGSLKTKTRWDQRAQVECIHDIQGLSEGWTAEKRFGKPIHSVQMLIIVKGRKERSQPSDDEQGHWFTNPFSHAWIRSTANNSMIKPGLEKAHTYGWLSGKLGSGWKLIPAHELAGGIELWVDQIQRGLIQPGVPPPVDKVLIKPLAIERQPRDQQEWARQTILQEREIQAKIALGTSEGNPLKYLVQSRGACHRPSDCPFLALCYGTADQSAEACRADPMSTGLYKKREPNHPQEIK